jgi:hypothetical protein
MTGTGTSFNTATGFSYFSFLAVFLLALSEAVPVVGTVVRSGFCHYQPLIRKILKTTPAK